MINFSNILCISYLIYFGCCCYLKIFPEKNIVHRIMLFESTHSCCPFLCIILPSSYSCMSSSQHLNLTLKHLFAIYVKLHWKFSFLIFSLYAYRCVCIYGFGENELVFFSFIYLFIATQVFNIRISLYASFGMYVTFWILGLCESTNFSFLLCFHFLSILFL